MFPERNNTIEIVVLEGECIYACRGRMLSQMPRSFTTRFQFVPTCEQTFWGYS